MPGQQEPELKGLRRWLHLKFRFGLSKLPFFPVRYRLITPGAASVTFLWTRVIPFMDPVGGAFNFDLWGWDVRELRFLRRFLRPGMTFLDIGAHDGLYSVLASKMVLREGLVLAFEPCSAVRRRLEWHLRLNAISPTKVFHCAVGARLTRLPLYTPVRGVDTVSSLRPPGVSQGPNRIAEVAVRPLDVIASEVALKSVDLIKLDVEGAEMEVIEGATALAQRHQPIWLFEALDATSGAWGGSGRALVDRFAGMGHALFEFSPEGWLRPHVAQASYPLDSNCNLLAVPSAKLPAIRSFLRA